MSGLPWPRNWSLDPRKIDGYLLDEAHIEGGPKARFFKRFGFETKAPLVLSSPTPHRARSSRRRCPHAAT